METPNYVLRAKEGVIVPKGVLQGFFRKVVMAIAAILIIGSLVFKENLLKELSWPARILLIILLIKVASPSRLRLASPIEIRFYSDYLLVYRENYYYAENLSRMEYNKFYYIDIVKCIYNTETHQIFIYGTEEAKWYDYNKDGSLPYQPTFYRIIENAAFSFHVGFSPEIDYKGIIERYSPIKVFYN